MGQLAKEVPGTIKKRGASIAEGRENLAWLGVELYGFPVKELAKGLDKQHETASRLVSRAAFRRAKAPDIRAKIQRVDSVIVRSIDDGG